MKHNAYRATLVATIAVPTLLVGRGVAHAAAPAGGCPTGAHLLSVDILAGEGYHAPGMVDDPYSGVLTRHQPGNGDGWVCGVQLGNKVTSFGLPI